MLAVSVSKKGSTVTFLYVLPSISSLSTELIESVTELVGWRTGHRYISSSLLNSPLSFGGLGGFAGVGGEDPLTGDRWREF